MVVAAHAPGVQIDQLLQSGEAVLQLEDLVDLFLVPGHREAGAAVLEHIGHFLGDCVLVDWNGHGSSTLGRDHRPV